METASSSRMILQALVGNDPMALSEVQLFLMPYAYFIRAFWIGLWILVAVFVLRHLYCEWRERRSDAI